MKQLVFGVGDTLLMKKNHACGEHANHFEVLTVGSDIKVKCLHCQREMMIPRVKLEKNIKSVIPKGEK